MVNIQKQIHITLQTSKDDDEKATKIIIIFKIMQRHEDECHKQPWGAKKCP